MTTINRKPLILLEITLYPTRTPAREHCSHENITSIITRGVVVEVCVALDVDRTISISVESTCAAPTDVESAFADAGYDRCALPVFRGFQHEGCNYLTKNLIYGQIRRCLVMFYPMA